MPEMPFPITGNTISEIKLQVTELLRILFEDRLGGYDRADLSENKLLSLDGSKDVVSTEESGYAAGILGTANQIVVTDIGDGTVQISLAQNVDTTELEGQIYYSGGQ